MNGIDNSASVRAIAHAKLTLSLRITGVRPDGYHLIDAEMVSLSLADIVTITAAVGSVGGGGAGHGGVGHGGVGSISSISSVDGRYADGIPTGADNLVTRALRLADRAASIGLTKNIPHGGGLGGGSADAAAVLRWAGWTGTPDELERAAALGADIAFCLVGGRARVRGIGEIVEPLPHLDRTVTLVIPPLRVSTPAAYRRWDELGAPTAPGPNDLEPAAISVEPELARWRDRIGDLTGRTPVLAGSGATWFVHGNHLDALATLADDGAGAEVLTANTVAP